MNYYLTIIASAIVLVTLAGCTSNTSTQEVSGVLDPSVSTSETIENSEEPTVARMLTKRVDSADIPNVPAHYSFTADILTDWEVEYIPASEAINIYDPASSEDSSLEQSQIYIKYFTASEFLTLSTVTIYSEEEFIINNRPAVQYDIEKQSGVANFPGQPTWRNQRHFVTDIRSTEANPTTFYVFAKNPELDEAVFDTFINSVSFTAE